MGLNKKYYKINLFSVFTLFALMACYNPNEKQVARGADSAKGVLELFCQHEFVGEGNVRRDLYAAYSPSRAKEVESSEYGGEIVVLDGDPIIIVSTYCIVGIKSNESAAKGTVVYERLAYTRGLGNDVNYNPNPPREIIPEYKESEEVDYDLKKINGRWYVYDPPVMRVSLAAVDRYYFGQATSFLPNDFWIAPKFSNEQRKNIAKKFNDIKVLMRISADYLDRLRERYKESGGPVHPDRERQKRVKASYTGKWNIEILPETPSKSRK